jgi:hypothetical protein
MENLDQEIKLSISKEGPPQTFLLHNRFLGLIEKLRDLIKEENSF